METVFLLVIAVSLHGFAGRWRGRLGVREEPVLGWLVLTFCVESSLVGMEICEILPIHEALRPEPAKRFQRSFALVYSIKGPA